MVSAAGARWSITRGSTRYKTFCERPPVVPTEWLRFVTGLRPLSAPRTCLIIFTERKEATVWSSNGLRDPSLTLWFGYDGVIMLIMVMLSPSTRGRHRTLWKLGKSFWSQELVPEWFYCRSSCPEESVRCLEGRGGRATPPHYSSSLLSTDVLTEVTLCPHPHLQSLVSRLMIVFVVLSAKEVALLQRGLLMRLWVRTSGVEATWSEGLCVSCVSAATFGPELLK